MSDLITIREYAALHGLNIETVKTRVKHNQLPVIRFGKSVMIDKNTPWAEIERRLYGNDLKVKITPAYYITVEDNSGKELASDFTFLTKAEAVKIGERMKKEVEDKAI